MVFYWTTTATDEEIKSAVREPAKVGKGITKLAASHWDVFLQYLLSKLSHCEIKFWEYEQNKGDRSPIAALQSIDLSLRTANQWRR
jgi:hypothetical protein